MYLNPEMEYEEVKVPGGLTLTWDVFKFYFFRTFSINWIWLTLTWDVFKFEK